MQNFAYVASHDLQEPLRKIVVFGERLVEKHHANLDPEARDFLERMQKAAARMQTLINDLLTFFRVTTKARPFAPSALKEIAGEVVGDVEGRIEQVQGRVEIGSLPVIEAEALQVWDQHQGRVDLLLTDMIMPGGMTGKDLAEQLRRLKPEIKIIYTSGYSAELMGKDFARGDSTFLVKPYVPSQLAQLVRTCLDAPARRPYTANVSLTTAAIAAPTASAMQTV